MVLGNRQADQHGFYALSSSIEKLSFKSNSRYLGLELLEEMFTCTLTPVMPWGQLTDYKIFPVQQRNCIRSVPVSSPFFVNF